MSKCIFFFGAGAEVNSKNIKMPFGNEFTIKTMFNNDSEKMSNALKEFYKKRNVEIKAKNPFPYNYDSKMFHCCVERLNEKTDLFTQELKGRPINRKSNVFYKKAYTILFNDYSRIKENQIDIYQEMAFSGGIEQYFSSLARRGKKDKNYWKLIFYYWNAFFTIIMPYADYFFINKEGYKDDKYSYILKNLDNLLSFDYISVHKKFFEKEFQYYEEIKSKGTDDYSIVTTNYMPFAEIITGYETLYLAGKIDEFENDLLDIKQYFEIPKTGVVFPFIMTQCPIKPIINPRQIKVYSNWVKKLEDANILIIIGYSLPENDQHIIAAIRDYILCGKKLIFYEYCKGCGRIKKVNNREICKRILLKEENKNVFVYKHNGKASNVINHAKKILKKLEKNN